MSEFLERVRTLVRQREVLVSQHGFRELANDDILIDDVLAGLEDAIVVEEYPTFVKGPCILVLQRDHQNRPIHILWGIAKGQATPAVLITAYRPDPNIWSSDSITRLRS
jgi:hypothetical protein